MKPQLCRDANPSALRAIKVDGGATENAFYYILFPRCNPVLRQQRMEAYIIPSMESKSTASLAPYSLLGNDSPVLRMVVRRNRDARKVCSS